MRPQLLDRFGLSVNVSTLLDVAQRTQMVLDRMAYEADADAFIASAAAEQVRSAPCDVVSGAFSAFCGFLFRCCV